jgi:prepilin-type N-terminal cleavage/methylation domain-containing protein/prepilin-type processing-associated H-X9-DG protein
MTISPQSRCAPRRAAFTLIELLVVIAIIAILIGLLIPAVQKVRDAAARGSCQNNLHQLGIGLQSYHDANGRFPAGGQSSGAGFSWNVFVLPYLEQANLYNQFDLTMAYNSSTVSATTGNANLNLALNPVPTFLCPAAHSNNQFSVGNTAEQVGSQKTYTAHYYGVIGPTGASATGTYPSSPSPYTPSNSSYGSDGVLGIDTGTKITDISDGSSNTFLVGEISFNDPNASTGYRMWTRGCSSKTCQSAKNVTYGPNTTKYNGSSNFNDISFGSNHFNGTNFAMADGSVKWVNNNVDLVAYKAAATKTGGESLPLP